MAFIGFLFDVSMDLLLLRTMVLSYLTYLPLFETLPSPLSLNIFLLFIAWNRWFYYEVLLHHVKILR
jgi:hypothetical protein